MTRPSGERVVLLATDCDSTRIIFHALRRTFADVRVVIETNIPRRRLLWRKIRRLGWTAAVGQFLFVGLIAPLLRFLDRDRVEQIKLEHGFDDSPYDRSVTHVPSVNSDATVRVLEELAPAVVVVNGTRIISRSTLSRIAAPIVNTHMGITPMFRGVHGGYWALVEGRPDLVGTTVHMVDEGIDTGRIVGQSTFSVSSLDSIATYPYLHLAVGIPVLLEAVKNILAGRDAVVPNPSLPSVLRYHPTAWSYILRRLREGIR